ncbi:MAG: hypothetical protein JW940_21685 [Polyangiaceae bacterium]|nr:hypothetical protein [Polyangiaceae bacterium]
MSDHSATVTAALEQLAGSRDATELLDVVVELRQDPAAAESVDQLRRSFGQMRVPVEKTISDLGGTVTGEAWINHTLRAQVPARGVSELSRVGTVRALDVPHQLEAD